MESPFEIRAAVNFNIRLPHKSFLPEDGGRNLAWIHVVADRIWFKRRIEYPHTFRNQYFVQNSSTYRFVLIVMLM